MGISAATTKISRLPGCAIAARRKGVQHDGLQHSGLQHSGVQDSGVQRRR